MELKDVEFKILDQKKLFVVQVLYHGIKECRISSEQDNP
jgi:hypothetical protein